MASIAVLQRAGARVGIILLAALAAAPSGLAQPAPHEEAGRQRQLVELVEQEEARNGPSSEGLIGPLSELALLYQDQAEHDLAVAALQRVRQLVRANEGLHSLEQIPLIQRLIANEEAAGRLETAWELEQDLLALARRHPDDLRTVPVFRDTAAKRTRLLREYLAGGSPPQIVFGCYHGWPQLGRRTGVDGSPRNYDEVISGSCTAGRRDDVVQAVVADAQRNYADAIAVILRNELYDSVELRELELGLLQSIEVLRARSQARTYGWGVIGAFDREPWQGWKLAMLRLVRWELPQPAAQPGVQRDDPLVGDLELGDPARGPDPGWIGARSVERLLAYELATSAPLRDQVEGLVRVADWYLVYGPTPNAFDGYELARKMLEEAGAQALLDELFAPKAPVVLPAFLPNPLASNETSATTGYIDVAFEIDRGGESRRIRVLDTTMNATEAAKTRLVRTIQSSRFRPRLTEGELARESPIELRYYVTD